MDIYQPRYLGGNHLAYLPVQVSLGKTQVSIQYLQQTEEDQVGRTIQIAADNGYNVGLDEYEDEDFLGKVVSVSNLFTVKEARPAAPIIGLVFIHPSFYCRGWLPAYGYFSIILTPQLHGLCSGVYGVLAGLAVDMARDINPEYVGVSTAVFTVHADWLVQLRKAGFQLSACIPFAGNLKSAKDVDSYLLCKKYSGERKAVDISKKVTYISN